MKPYSVYYVILRKPVFHKHNICCIYIMTLCTNLHETRIALSFLSLADSSFSRSMYVSLQLKVAFGVKHKETVQNKYYSCMLKHALGWK